MQRYVNTLKSAHRDIDFYVRRIKERVREALKNLSADTKIYYNLFLFRHRLINENTLFERVPAVFMAVVNLKLRENKGVKTPHEQSKPTPRPE